MKLLVIFCCVAMFLFIPAVNGKQSEMPSQAGYVSIGYIVFCILFCSAIPKNLPYYSPQHTYYSIYFSH